MASYPISTPLDQPLRGINTPDFYNYCSQHSLPSSLPSHQSEPAFSIHCKHKISIIPVTRDMNTHVRPSTWTCMKDSIMCWSDLPVQWEKWPSYRSQWKGVTQKQGPCYANSLVSSIRIPLKWGDFLYLGHYDSLRNVCKAIPEDKSIATVPVLIKAPL